MTVPVTSQPRRWLPPLLGLATFLVVLVALGGVAGDLVARNVEMQSLISSIEQSESAMGDLQAEVQQISSRYESQVPLDDAQRGELDAALMQAAAGGRDAIAAAGAKVEAVRWLAWHRDVQAAQEAYLAHNRAWQQYLDRASRDPAEFARQQDKVNSTFGQAEIDIRAALPLIPLFDLADRIDVIFAPAPAGPGEQV